MPPAGQDPETRLASGTVTLPLCSQTNARSFLDNVIAGLGQIGAWNDPRGSPSPMYAALLLSCVIPAFAGQAPGAANSPDIAISHRDRFYTSDQFSNTCRSLIPSTTSCLASFALAIRRLEISVRSTGGNCWCTGLDFRRIIARSQWCPSALTP